MTKSEKKLACEKPYTKTMIEKNGRENNRIAYGPIYLMKQNVYALFICVINFLLT